MNKAPRLTKREKKKRDGWGTPSPLDTVIKDTLTGDRVTILRKGKLHRPKSKSKYDPN